MGNTMNLPIEAVEAAVPIRFLAYELVRDSAGPGRRRGGAGVRKAFEALAPVEVSILGERTHTSAHGVAGGGPGKPARFVHAPAGGAETVLTAKSGPHRLAEGDRIDMTTAGGGGWGESRST
jgi:N-methylhydantoinase B